jgi:hypothetical protein
VSGRAHRDHVLRCSRRIYLCFCLFSLARRDAAGGLPWRGPWSEREGEEEGQGRGRASLEHRSGSKSVPMHTAHCTSGPSPPGGMGVGGVARVEEDGREWERQRPPIRPFSERFTHRSLERKHKIHRYI